MQKVKTRSPHHAAIIREVEPEVRPKVSFHPLVQIPSHGELFVVSLSPRLIKVPTHWDAYQRKVLYCFGHGQCPSCAKSYPANVYGYACVSVCRYTGDRWKLDGEGLLCLPHSSLTNNKERITKREDLRGRVLRIFRMTTKTVNRPVIVEVTESTYKEVGLHPEWDVMTSLASLFGLVVKHREN